MVVGVATGFMEWGEERRDGRRGCARGVIEMEVEVDV